MSPPDDASAVAGRSHVALEPGLLVPYGAWRRWVRALRAGGVRRRGGDSGDRVYLAYGLTLVTLMYVPVAWVAVQQAGVALSRGAGSGPVAPDDLLLLLGAALVAAAGLGAPAAARAGLPLWVSAPDARYVHVGVWRARTVLWRRGLLLLAVAGVLGAVLGSALASGVLAAAAPTTADLVAWGLCAAGFALAVVALGAAAQGTRRATPVVGRLLVAVPGLAYGVLSVVTGACPATGPCLPGPLLAGPPSAVVGAAAVVALVSGWLVLAVLPDAVDVDAAAAAGGRTRATGVGLAVGDGSGLRPGLAPGRSGRGAGLSPTLLRASPLVARDVLGLRRRPGRAVGSVLAGALGAALVAGAQDVTLVAVVGALLLYGASAPWAGGLDALASQPVPGGLLPGRVGRQVAAHAVVPGLVGLVVAAGGLLVAIAVAGVDAAESAVPLFVALVAVLGVRVGVAGARTVPAAAFTPVAGPTGDLSLLTVAAWYLRGWLLVAAVAWATVRLGPGVLGLVLLLVVGLVAAAVRRVARA